MFYITVKYEKQPQYHQVTFEDLFTNNIPESTSGYLIHRTVARETLSNDLKTWYQYQAQKIWKNIGPIITAYSNKKMEDQYTHFKIPKRSGGLRQIDAPNDQLKQDMRNVLNVLQNNRIYPHKAAYAYVQNRTAADAARLHAATQNTQYLKLDLHNFFGSCTSEFIKQQLLKDPAFYYLEPEALDMFIHFVTYNGALPQGSNISPWLTNIIMRPIDYEIGKICREEHITYTRYADDMNFSHTMTKGASFHLLNEIKALLKDTPLTINEEKTKMSTRAGQTHILGLTITQDSKVTVNNKRKEAFRATLHEFILHRDNWSPQEAMELLGKLNYYETVEPDYFKALLERLNNKHHTDVKHSIIEKIKTA